jgi:hypothetical protein
MLRNPQGVGSLRNMSWIVRPVIGTHSDTPTSLRLKAAEFQRPAGKSRNALVIEELKRLAATYLEEAERREAGAGSPARSDTEARTN